jgi:hypothetical protein
MNDLQSIAAYPVGARPEGAVEELTVKGKKPEEGEFTFWDFLDVINPLQHIPVVNTIYREMTGDEIKAPAKMLGSAIIGGPIGLAAAMIDTAIEDATGKDLGGHAMAMFKDSPEQQNVAPESNAATQVAAAVTTAPQVRAATSAREFIPAGLTVAQSNATATSIANEAKAVQRTSQSANQETEVAIAAAAAATPQGLVFMPLPGREASTYRATASQAPDSQFMAIDRSGRRVPSNAETSRQQINQAALAQLQAQGAVPAGLSQNSNELDPLLDATRPTGDTGKMPAADPFAAARFVSEDASPVMVPAWFDSAMMDAMGKYDVMQNADP